MPQAPAADRIRAHLATVDALRLRSETPPPSGSDVQVPPSWNRITDAFWRPGAAPPAYAAFSAAVAAAVDDAVPPGPADATLPEQRCRRTFTEFLQGYCEVPIRFRPR